MNDKYKFRFYNLETKKMYYANRNNKFLIGFKYYDISALLKDKRFVPMQSMGFKDCKGNLIYHGDIVEGLTYCDGKHIFEQYTVDYCRYNCLALTKKDDFSLIDEEAIKVFKIRVIGNIYE